MIPSIAEVVSKFKQEWTKWLEPAGIQAICNESGLRWRERLLSPVTTIQLLLLQVLHGNTAISHLPHIAKKRFTPAAYCKARKRLPLRLLEKINERVRTSLFEKSFEKSKWLGHRIFISDGTGVSMPDTPELKARFGYPHRQRKECSFPVAKLLVMMHFQTGMVVKAFIDHLFTHDISRAPQLHEELKENDIIVGDRAFCSYHHFCCLLKRKIHAVIRMHQKLAADFTPGRPHVPPGEIPSELNQPKSRWISALGVKDQLVEWFRSDRKLKWMTKEEFQELPKSIIVRELQYRIAQKGFRTTSVTIITTLINEKLYPKNKIAELYGFRWEIETNFNHLKTSMKMDILKSKSPNGIIKELLAYFIVYNLVRLVMLKAAVAQGVKIKSISFKDALRWLTSAQPEEILLALMLLPIRPERYEPRNKKRREKPYPYMLQPRQELRKKKLSQILTR